MNKKAEKLLDALELPEIDLPHHRDALRRQLFMMHAQNTQKGGEVFFMKRKLFRIWAVGIVSLALVVAVSITFVVPQTPQAQAQEIVNHAMDRIIRLTDDERKVLEDKLKADLKGSLEEAKQAKDLTVVPEEEIERIDPPKEIGIGKEDVFMTAPEEEKVVPGKMMFTKEMKPGTKVAFSGKVMAPHGVKVLRYTGPNGEKTILGINEQNEPVMKMMFLSEKDAKGLPKGENIHFERVR